MKKGIAYTVFEIDEATKRKKMICTETHFDDAAVEFAARTFKTSEVDFSRFSELVLNKIKGRAKIASMWILGSNDFLNFSESDLEESKAHEVVWAIRQLEKTDATKYQIFLSYLELDDRTISEQRRDKFLSNLHDLSAKIDAVGGILVDLKKEINDQIRDVELFYRVFNDNERSFEIAGDLEKRIDKLTNPTPFRSWTEVISEIVRIAEYFAPDLGENP